MDLSKALFLPPVGSAHGHEVDFIINVIHILMFALLFGWGIYFFFALFKFRKGKNPKANYHGVQSHLSSLIEIGIVLFEVILLVAFAIPFWTKQVNTLPDRPDTVEVRVVAEQFAWNFHYPGADGLFGNTDISFFDKQSNPVGLDPNDPSGKDDFTTINQLHLPIGRPAILYLTSRDVIHSFGIPVMRVKQDVIPGMVIPTWFTPTMSGQFDISCAQLCGLGHYRMKGYLTIDHAEAYQTWTDEQAAASGGGDDEEFDDFWN